MTGAGDWAWTAGVRPADPSLSARMGARLSGLPGRWRWAVERLLRWWFAELSALAPRPRPAAGGSMVDVPEEDCLTLAATLPIEAVNLAGERAQLLIAERTPFAADAVLAGTMLTSIDAGVRLTIRLVPLTRLVMLAPDGPGGVDAVALNGMPGEPLMCVPTALPDAVLTPTHRAAVRTRRRRARLLPLSAVLAALIILILPIATRRHVLAAEEALLTENRAVLQPALRRAAQARAERQAAIEVARIVERSPSAIDLLAGLSDRIGHGSHLTELRLSGDEVTLAGLSDAPAALPALIEADPALADARLVAAVQRDATDGRQRFRIAARVAGRR